MHKRGTKLLIGISLFLYVASFFGGFFLPSETQKAEAAYTMPKTIKEYIVANAAYLKEQLRQDDPNHNNWEFKRIKEFIQVLDGDACRGEDDACRGVLSDGLIDAITSGRLEKLSATSSLHTLTANDWKGTYVNVYNSLYWHVGLVDETWALTLDNESNIGFNSLYDQFDDTYGAPGSYNFSKFQTDFTKTRDMIKNRVMPELTVVYAGLLLMKGMSINTTVITEAKKDTADFEKLAVDLDIDTNKINKQTKKIYKRTNYQDALVKETDAGHKEDLSVYAHTADFYRDLSLFAPIVLGQDPAGITDDKTVDGIKTQIWEAAKKMDKNKGTDTTNGGGRCGEQQTNFFGVSTDIAYAFCALAIQGQSFAGDMLRLSMSLLSNTANISGSNGEVSWLPQQLRGNMQGLFVDTSNATALVIRTVTVSVQRLVNILITIFFIVIALASVFQVKVDTYGINKLLPAIVIGFVLSLFSIYIVRVGLEIADVGANAVLNIDASDKSSLTTGYLRAFTLVGGSTTGELTNSAGNTDLSKVFQQFVLNALTIAAAVMVFVLAFLFVIRSIVFFFLAPLAPIAFFSAPVSPLKSIWTRWSKTFMGWLFMPVVSMFWLWLGFKWLAATNDPKLTGLSATTGFTGVDVLSYLLGYAFAMTCLYFAIKTPFSMAGEAKMLLDKWNGFGKKAWGKTGGALLKSQGGQLKDGLTNTAKRRNILWNQSIADRLEDRKKMREMAKKEADGSFNARYNKKRAEQLKAAEKAGVELPMTFKDKRKDRINVLGEDVKIIEESQKNHDELSKLNSSEYQARKAIIESLHHATHEIEGALKEVIRGMINGNNVAKPYGDAIKHYHEESMKYKAKAILAKELAEKEETTSDDHWMHYMERKEFQGKNTGVNYLLQAQINAEQEQKARAKPLEKRRYKAEGQLNATYKDEEIVNEYLALKDLSILDDSQWEDFDGALERLIEFHEDMGGADEKKNPFKRHYAGIRRNITASKTKDTGVLTNYRDANKKFGKEIASNERRKEMKKATSKDESQGRIDNKAADQLKEGEFIEKLVGNNDDEALTTSMKFFAGRGSEVDTRDFEDRLHAQKAINLTFSTEQFDEGEYGALGDHIQDVRDHAKKDAHKNTFVAKEFTARQERADDILRSALRTESTKLGDKFEGKYRELGIKEADIDSIDLPTFLKKAATIKNNREAKKAVIGILNTDGLKGTMVVSARDAAKSTDTRHQESVLLQSQKGTLPPISSSTP